MNALSPAIHISDIAAKVAEVLKAYRGYCAEFGIDDGHQVIINNSGGKDSGATELLARAIFGDNYRSVAADTGNAGHFRLPCAVECHGKAVGQLRQIRTTGAGVNQRQGRGIHGPGFRRQAHSVGRLPDDCLDLGCPIVIPQSHPVSLEGRHWARHEKCRSPCG